MTLHAVHLAFCPWVMLGKMELCVDIQMALIAGLRILPGIDDELFASRPADGDMRARGTMARFTAVLGHLFASSHSQARVRTGGESACDFGVAIDAGLVTDKCGSFD